MAIEFEALSLKFDGQCASPFAPIDPTLFPDRNRLACTPCLRPGPLRLAGPRCCFNCFTLSSFTVTKSGTPNQINAVGGVITYTPDPTCILDMPFDSNIGGLMAGSPTGGFSGLCSWKKEAGLTSSSSSSSSVQLGGYRVTLTPFFATQTPPYSATLLVQFWSRSIRSTLAARYFSTNFTCGEGDVFTLEAGGTTQQWTVSDCNGDGTFHVNWPATATLVPSQC